MARNRKATSSNIFPVKRLTRSLTDSLASLTEAAHRKNGCYTIRGNPATKACDSLALLARTSMLEAQMEKNLIREFGRASSHNELECTRQGRRSSADQKSSSDMKNCIPSKGTQSSPTTKTKTKKNALSISTLCMSKGQGLTTMFTSLNGRTSLSRMQRKRLPRDCTKQYFDSGSLSKRKSKWTYSSISAGLELHTQARDISRRPRRCMKNERFNSRKVIQGPESLSLACLGKTELLTGTRLLRTKIKKRTGIGNILTDQITVDETRVTTCAREPIRTNMSCSFLSFSAVDEIFEPDRLLRNDTHPDSPSIVSTRVSWPKGETQRDSAQEAPWVTAGEKNDDTTAPLKRSISVSTQGDLVKQMIPAEIMKIALDYRPGEYCGSDPCLVQSLHFRSIKDIERKQEVKNNSRELRKPEGNNNSQKFLFGSVLFPCGDYQKSDTMDNPCPDRGGSQATETIEKKQEANDNSLEHLSGSALYPCGDPRRQRDQFYDLYLDTGGTQPRASDSQTTAAIEILEEGNLAYQYRQQRRAYETPAYFTLLDSTNSLYPVGPSDHFVSPFGSSRDTLKTLKNKGNDNSDITDIINQKTGDLLRILHGNELSESEVMTLAKENEELKEQLRVMKENEMLRLELRRLRKRLRDGEEVSETKAEHFRPNSSLADNENCLGRPDCKDTLDDSILVDCLQLKSAGSPKCSLADEVNDYPIHSPRERRKRKSEDASEFELCDANIPAICSTVAVQDHQLLPSDKISSRTTVEPTQKVRNRFRKRKTKNHVRVNIRKRQAGRASKANRVTHRETTDSDNNIDSPSSLGKAIECNGDYAHPHDDHGLKLPFRRSRRAREPPAFFKPEEWDIRRAKNVGTAKKSSSDTMSDGPLSSLQLENDEFSADLCPSNGPHGKKHGSASRGSHLQNEKVELPREECKPLQSLDSCRDRCRTLPQGKKPSISDSSNSAEIWLPGEVGMLKKAKDKVNPTSKDFWTDVATHIAGKTAESCRDKWFALFKTPKPKPNRLTSKLSRQISSGEEEDDVFDSTPLRFVDKKPSKQIHTNKSPILVGTKSWETDRGDGDCLNDDEGRFAQTRPGHKSYLLAMKRDISREHKKLKFMKKRPKKTFEPSGFKTLTETLQNRDIDIRARLSPGGTFNVDGGCHEEDDFWDEIQSD